MKKQVIKVHYPLVLSGPKVQLPYFVSTLKNYVTSLEVKQTLISCLQYNFLFSAIVKMKSERLKTGFY